MHGDSLKKAIERLVKRLGPKQVQVALVTAGVGVSTAEKLVAGRYGSTPKGETALAIERLLKRHGSRESA